MGEGFGINVVLRVGSPIGEAEGLRDGKLLGTNVGACMTDALGVKAVTEVGKAVGEQEGGRVGAALEIYVGK